MSHICRKVHIHHGYWLHKIFSGHCVCLYRSHSNMVNRISVMCCKSFVLDRSRFISALYSTKSATLPSVQSQFEFQSEPSDEDKNESRSIRKHERLRKKKFKAISRKALAETGMDSSQAYHFLNHIKEMTPTLTDESTFDFQKLHGMIEDWYAKNLLGSDQIIQSRLTLLEEIGCTVDQIIECADILVELTTVDIIRCHKMLKKLNVDPISVILLQTVNLSPPDFIESSVDFISQVFSGKQNVSSLIQAKLNCSTEEMSFLHSHVATLIKSPRQLLYFCQCVDKLQLHDMKRDMPRVITDLIVKRPKATMRRLDELEQMGMLFSNGHERSFLSCEVLLTMHKKEFSAYKAEKRAEILGECEDMGEWLSKRLGAKPSETYMTKLKNIKDVMCLEESINVLLNNGITTEEILMHPKWLCMKSSTLKRKFTMFTMNNKEMSVYNAKKCSEILGDCKDIGEWLSKKLGGKPSERCMAILNNVKDVMFLEERINVLLNNGITTEKILKYPECLYMKSSILEKKFTMLNLEGKEGDKLAHLFGAKNVVNDSDSSVSYGIQSSTLNKVLGLPSSRLNKHPPSLLKPLRKFKVETLQVNLNYLLEQDFTEEDIADSPLILLHDKKILEKYIIYINNSEEKHLKSSQKLNLIQYHIEKENGFLQKHFHPAKIDSVNPTGMLDHDLFDEDK